MFHYFICHFFSQFDFFNSTILFREINYILFQYVIYLILGKLYDILQVFINKNIA